MPIDISSIPDDLLKVNSQDAILSAQPLFTFRRFVEVKNELNARPGKKVSFPRLGYLDKGKILTSEYTPVPEASKTNSFVEIEVFEAANSTSSSQLVNAVSYRDELTDLAMLLGLDYQQVLDDYLMSKYMGTTNVQFANGAANTASILAGSFFDTDEIDDAMLTLKLLKAPPLRRGNDLFYVCVAHPKQIRNLKNSTGWQDAHKYVDPTAIYAGEAGRYNNIIFIETTQMPVEVGAGASGQNIYNAVIFGSRAVGFIDALPFELRQDPPTDMGRFIRIGWYSILGAGILNDFIVRVKTS